MDIQLLSVHTKFFLTMPSSFKTRLMVLSEGYCSPDLTSSHLIAETPTWAKRSRSKRFLVDMIACLLSPLVFVGLRFGFLGRSENQLLSPDWNRLSHLKNHFFERPRLLYMDFGLSPFICLWIACFRMFSSSIPVLLSSFMEAGILYYKGDKSNLCLGIKMGIKGNLCPGTFG